MESEAGKGAGWGRAVAAAQEARRLKLHPPFAQPDPGRRALQQIGESESDSSAGGAAMRATHETEATFSSPDLPSIQHFIDDLPSIDEFLVEPPGKAMSVGGPGSDYRTGREPSSVGPLEIDEEGWAAADWQTYNWSGLASLRSSEPEAAEARAAWASTNWDSAAAGSHQAGGADVAEALSEIARRIRSGELSLEQFRGSPPEAALAALFAAFLRSKG